MKIYNEIVIDMNPESSTFEETLHEDSYEYKGDMMLMQGNVVWIATQTVGTRSGAVRVYARHTYQNGNWVLADLGSRSGEGNEITKDKIPEGEKIYDTKSQASYDEGVTTEWGAGVISKDDFVDPATGKPRSLQEVYELLDPKIPGKTDKELKELIRDTAPKFTGEMYGMEEERGFAKEAYKEDIYGLRRGAGQVGAAMRGGYGGGGASMRAGIAGAGEVGRGFQQAQQGYKEDIYGIDKDVSERYETDIEGWLEPSWFKTDDDDNAREGGYVRKDGSGVSRNLEETFLDVLTQLPDAGGS